MMIPAEKCHIAEIARLEQEAFTDSWSESSLESTLSSDSCFLADISEGAVRGYLIGTCDGYSGYIERVAVGKAYRRMGIGKSLLDEFEKALPPSADSISLEVRVSNVAAIALYEGFGFERAGIRRNMYSNPREDAAVMIKKVIR